MQSIVDQVAKPRDVDFHVIELCAVSSGVFGEIMKKQSVRVLEHQCPREVLLKISGRLPENLKPLRATRCSLAVVACTQWT